MAENLFISNFKQVLMTANYKNILPLRTFNGRLVAAVLFILLVVAADYFIGKVMKHFYQAQSSGYDYGTRYSIEETKADILIFGASRAQQQYNPQFIEDSLQMTCYNVGRDGMPFFYHYAVLQGVLKRYTPKIILLDCEYSVLKKSESSYERLSPLLPFYKDHPELRSVIELRGPFEKYKLLSNIYPYNSLMFKIAAGNRASGKKKNETIKGYMPLTHSLDEPIKTIDYTNAYELDTLKVNMLQAFIDDCKKRNIQLFIICSPYYINSIGTDYSIQVVKEKAAANNVDFLDYSKEKAFLSNSKLFDDTVHVNFTGSKLFSSMIARDIKTKIIHK